MKPKVGLESLVGPEGPLSIVTVGASVSTLKSRIAVSVFPAGSDTRTLKVQLPSASGPAAWDVPLVHGPKSATPWSTEHWTVVAPLGVKPKVGLESLVGPEGPLSIVTVGASVSTENACVAVSESSISSVTRTRKIQSPSARVSAVCVVSEVQGPKFSTPWSTEHSTVVAPLGVKPKVGVESLVGPEGPLSIVTAGTASAVAANAPASTTAAPTAARRTDADDPTRLLSLTLGLIPRAA